MSIVSILPLNYYGLSGWKFMKTLNLARKETPSALQFLSLSMTYELSVIIYGAVLSCSSTSLAPETVSSVSSKGPSD